LFIGSYLILHRKEIGDLGVHDALRLDCGDGKTGILNRIEAQKARNSRQDCHEGEILRRQLSRFSAFIGMDETCACEK